MSASSFWVRYPALLYGLAAYFGAMFSLSPTYLLLVPLIALAPTICSRFILALFVGSAIFLAVQSKVHLPDTIGNGLIGVARIELIDCVEELRFGKPIWKVKFYVHAFRIADDVFGGFTAAASLPADIARPKGGFIYGVGATLTRASDGFFQLKPHTKVWRSVEKVFSVLETRLKLHQYFSIFLAKHIKASMGRSFLEGISTGVTSDGGVKESLSRFGLQHILVVSGFHFSLAVAIAIAIFSLFLPFRYVAICSLILATGYLLFIGPTPSVIRSYVAAVLFIIGRLLCRQPSGLNSLGIGLLVVVLYEPTYCLQLSFQLSFLATFAILLFYPLLLKLFKKYTTGFIPREIVALNPLEQIAICIFSFCRASLCLVLAVHLFIAPLLLYYFHSFPLLGFLYNIFFPPLAAFSIILLIISTLISFIPYVSGFIFEVLSWYIETFLSLASEAPEFLDISFSLDFVSKELLIIFLSGVMIAGILFRVREKNPSDQFQLL